MKCILDQFINDQFFHDGAQMLHDRNDQIVRHRTRDFHPGKFHLNAGGFQKTDDDRELPVAGFFPEDNDLVLAFFINNDLAQLDLDIHSSCPMTTRLPLPCCFKLTFSLSKICFSSLMNWFTSRNCRYTEANRTYATSSTTASVSIISSPTTLA